MLKEFLEFKQERLYDSKITLIAQKYAYLVYDLMIIQYMKEIKNLNSLYNIIDINKNLTKLTKLTKEKIKIFKD